MAGIGALAVLDANLHPIGANREFHRLFSTTPQTLGATVSRILDVPVEQGQEMRLRVERMIAGEDPLQIIRWPDISGTIRSLVLAPAYGWNEAGQMAVLLLEDVTDRLLVEQRLADRAERNELMMEEMRHRLANSLQIVASILQIKARLVETAEGRRHLEDVHERVLAIAELQDQLDAAKEGNVGSIADYLSTICARLADSLIDPSKGIELRVEAADVEMPPYTCISIGLVVSELVVNALKHAFPGRTSGVIRIAFAVQGAGWTLTVADDGVGCDAEAATSKPGVGTRIVRTLARRMRAQLRIMPTHAHGLTVVLTHHGTTTTPL